MYENEPVVGDIDVIILCDRGLVYDDEERELAMRVFLERVTT